MKITRNLIPTCILATVGLMYVSGCCNSQKSILVKTNRSSQYPILDIILHRWSPRAMSGAPITQQELMTVLEAGRWAPSVYNNQPWHFIYGMRATEAWNTLFGLLVPFNQAWCANGAALVCVVTAKNYIKTGEPSPTHVLDTGAAWENIALQATNMGLVCHGMEGFDYEKAQELLHVPESHEIAMMFVLGKPAPVSVLPAELAERDIPTDRIPLEQLISEGVFEQKRK